MKNNSNKIKEVSIKVVNIFSKINFNKVLNVLLVIVTISIIINGSVAIYLIATSSYQNNKTPYRYETSSKYIDYLITNTPTGLYYDESLKGLFIYNSLYDISTNIFLYGYDFETLKDMLFNFYEDVEYVEVDENIYSIANPYDYDCNNIVISTKFDKEHKYQDHISKYIYDINLCFNGF